MGPPLPLFSLRRRDNAAIFLPVPWKDHVLSNDDLRVLFDQIYDSRDRARASLVCKGWLEVGSAVIYQLWRLGAEMSTPLSSPPSLSPPLCDVGGFPLAIRRVRGCRRLPLTPWHFSV